MAFAKRFLIAIFLSLGAVAATAPLPAVAQTISVQDVENVIDIRISELEDEITAAIVVRSIPIPLSRRRLTRSPSSCRTASGSPSCRR